MYLKFKGRQNKSRALELRNLVPLQEGTALGGAWECFLGGWYM